LVAAVLVVPSVVAVTLRRAPRLSAPSLASEPSYTERNAIARKRSSAGLG